MVEHRLAKARVASSNLVSRSNSQFVGLTTPTFLSYIIRPPSTGHDDPKILLAQNSKTIFDAPPPKRTYKNNGKWRDTTVPVAILAGDLAWGLHSCGISRPGGSGIGGDRTRSKSSNGFRDGQFSREFSHRLVRIWLLAMVCRDDPMQARLEQMKGQCSGRRLKQFANKAAASEGPRARRVG